jgi:hypothetical protein
MPREGFEPTIPAFEWAKTVHALDRATTVFGKSAILDTQKLYGNVVHVNGLFNE